MAQIRLKYLSTDTDRHGNRRHYLRRPGHPKVRLPGEPGSPAFMAAYFAAMEGKGTAPKPARRAGSDSLLGLCQAYFASAEFSRLAAETRRARRGELERLCSETVSRADATPIGTLPFAGMTRHSVRALRDRIADRPEAANHRLKALSALFAWAIATDRASDNPAAGIPKIRTGSTGHHTWTRAEIAAFEARWPVGSKARLALALLLYTGQRISDVARLGPQHVSEGRIRIVQRKNRARAPVTVEIPVLEPLAQILAATPTGHLSFLVTAHGTPFSVKGLGNKMREWCDAAGLKHCSAHGLRKAGATLAAEGGATPHQLMAIFGWRTLKQADHYTRAASARQLAAAGLAILSAQTPNGTVPPSARVADGETKRAKKRL